MSPDIACLSAGAVRAVDFSAHPRRDGGYTSSFISGPKSCWESFRPIGSTFGRCVFALPAAPFLRVAITRPTLRFLLLSRNVRECRQQEVRCNLTTLICKPLSNEIGRASCRE